MRKKHPVLFLALVLLLFASIWGTAVLAQTSSNLNLEWNVIGNGGQETNSANYSVIGTIGQNIASQPLASSTSFNVSSGFWFVNPGATIFLPVIIK
jgi:hypothetical protein